MTVSADTESRSPITDRPLVITPGRIVALVLLLAAVAGLAYLRFGPDSVPVPAGAKAGDVILERCDYGTEDGSYAADCGTLVVPENRADPQSRLIALPVTRIRARSGNRAEPIFRLQGGPGITNMEFREASRFADDRDVVLVGYRGMDGSSVLDCPEVESAMKHSTDLLGEKSFRERGDAFRACANRLRDDGVDLAGYSVPQRVDDLEAARVALGYDRIDLVSESMGTRLAMIYSWRYPRSIHRSVMLGVNPPGHFVWDEKTTDEQIGRYAALCSKDDACRKRARPVVMTTLAMGAGMLPIALGVITTLEASHTGGLKTYRIGVLLMLSYAATAGGLATIIGTPPNLIGAGMITEQLGVTISFFAWMGFGVPLGGSLIPWIDRDLGNGTSRELAEVRHDARVLEEHRRHQRQRLIQQHVMMTPNKVILAFRNLH